MRGDNQDVFKTDLNNWALCAVVRSDEEILMYQEQTGVSCYHSIDDRDGNYDDLKQKIQLCLVWWFDGTEMVPSEDIDQYDQDLLFMVIKDVVRLDIESDEGPVDMYEMLTEDSKEFVKIFRELVQQDDIQQSVIEILTNSLLESED